MVESSTLHNTQVDINQIVINISIVVPTLTLLLLGPLILRNGKALETNRSSEAGPEVLFHLRRRHSVVGSLGPGKTWHNCGQVKMMHLGKHGVLAFVVEVSEHACGFQICCDVLHTLLFSTSLHKIIQRPLVHRKEPYGSPILGTHVGNGCPVSNTQLLHARPKELNKLADDANLPQVLGNC